MLAYARHVGDVFAALADPTRRALLDELCVRSPQTLFELTTRLAQRHGLTPSRQAISQHLDRLQAVGLVRRRREGRYTWHEVDITPLDEFRTRWLPQKGETP